MARLASTVHVHESDGTVVIYNEGAEVPAKHAKLITNPKAWEGDAPAAEAATSSHSGTEQATGDQSGAEQQSGGNGSESQSQGSGGDGEGTSGTPAAVAVKPPAVGKGSGTAEWSAYATNVGIEVPADANRATIIELVTEHEAKAQGN